MRNKKKQICSKYIQTNKNLYSYTYTYKLRVVEEHLSDSYLPIYHLQRKRWFSLFWITVKTMDHLEGIMINYYDFK